MFLTRLDGTAKPIPSLPPPRDKFMVLIPTKFPSVLIIAMINTDGNLVGINTMNLSLGGGSDGIGLAVPSNLVRNITEQIIKYGRVVRGL